MQYLKIVFYSLLITGLYAQNSVALEVDREVAPRISLGGRVISTLDAEDFDSQPDAEGGINLSDSTILTRFDKRLYNQGVAGAVIGIQEHESSLLFHQLHAFYWNQDIRLELGRARLRNSLLEFPLLRDDDLLDYTHIGNASSNEEFDQIYADNAALDWQVDGKIQKLGIWAASRRNGESLEFNQAPGGFDSFGVGYQYQQAEDLRYVKRIRHAGILYDRQKVKFGAHNAWLNALLAGIEFNINGNPLSNWSLALQTIYNDGLGDANQVNSVAERAAAKSIAWISSVRYTSRPKLLTRWQAALNFAYKEYSDIDNATQWSIVPNWVYRVGQGIDVFTQLKYTDYDSALGDGEDLSAQFGVAFSLETKFNDNIGERDSILNLEHGYIN